MHDIDRTQNYFESEFDPEFFEYEAEGEYSDEAEGEYDFEAESELDEVEEMELAADLLEITDEAELDQFIGKLFKKAKRGVGKFLKSSTGRKLGGMLKGVAKTALPKIGGVLGSFVAPGIGTAIGSQLGSAAAGLFGLELEGLSPQDQEYEVARRFVRLANSAASRARQLQSHLPPDSAARKALMDAARKHAPGLLQALSSLQFENGSQQGGAASPRGGTSSSFSGQTGRSGRWVRRGRRIILLGV